MGQIRTSNSAVLGRLALHETSASVNYATEDKEVNPHLRVERDWEAPYWTPIAQSNIMTRS
uniref:(California timema) hypothetical protein n=1 Tax=Timema californicum TaxID=61474 RepID=A0A7R9JD04_TIMCA|nr:unnamed protein product [Timema californicum]